MATSTMKARVSFELAPNEAPRVVELAQREDRAIASWVQHIVRRHATLLWLR